MASSEDFTAGKGTFTGPVTIAGNLSVAGTITSANTGGPVIPSTLKYSANLGDGTATTFTVTHSLGTQDVIVQVREAATPFDVVLADCFVTDANTVVVSFTDPPSIDQFRITVMG